MEVIVMFMLFLILLATAIAGIVAGVRTRSYMRTLGAITITQAIGGLLFLMMILAVGV